MNVLMNVLVRCDSSDIIGTGHVMRCLNLCEYYPTWNFTFVCRNFKLNITDKIMSAKHKLILLDYNVEPELNNYDTWIGVTYDDEQNDIIGILNTEKYDIIIFDHYGIDHILEYKVRKYCKKVIVITELFNKQHYCDVFINYNTDNLDNVKQINLCNDTHYKIGAENILINKRFLNSSKTIYNKTIKTITINMGGADPQNYILKVLNNIKNYVLQQNIIVNIIIGYSNKNYNAIINFIKDANANTEANTNANANSNLFIIHFDIDFDKLIAIYLDSDLAIGSLSITAYERLFLKIPQICIKIAENQLIQELDVFNIINISCLMEKLNDYQNILNNQIQYSTKFINQNRFIVYFNDIII